VTVGFRFRKRVKLLPGVWVNLSKGGVSTSVGGKGLTVNLKSSKVKTTASIPGTGMSYSETADTQAHQATTSDPAPARAGIPIWVWLLLFVIVLALLVLK
jgi:hypothetical protein